MTKRRFGVLDGFFTPPAHGGAASSLIVSLHGGGADASDIADLAYPVSLRFPGAAFRGPRPHARQTRVQRRFPQDHRPHPGTL